MSPHTPPYSLPPEPIVYVVFVALCWLHVSNANVSVKRGDLLGEALAYCLAVNLPGNHNNHTAIARTSSGGL